MSSAIIISSSPPLFARDPTPVTTSPLGSQNSAQRSELHCSPKRFKTSSAIRDSFSHGFSSARALLPKLGAENLPLQSTPPRDRFRATLASPNRWTPPPFITTRSDLKTAEYIVRASEIAPVNIPTPASSEALDQSLACHTPQRGERAIPRKTDWTPATDDPGLQDLTDSEYFANEDVRIGLMDNFGFKTTKTGSGVYTNVAASQGVVKRTKIELVEVAGPIVQKAEKRKGRTPAPKKPKAPAKKAKTITDLVTSHQRGVRVNESTLADYLVATHARVGEESTCDDDIEVAITSKRPRTATKLSKVLKSKLLSPTSAMKAVKQQQTMFGSFSQLARDEPLVEMDLSSDPVSPLRTQPMSIESTTPRVERGTSRFIRTRNLWGAAERNENNAVVFDTAGTVDILGANLTAVGHRTSHHPVHITSTMALQRKYPPATMIRPQPASPPRTFHTTAVLDVDNFTSPMNSTVAHVGPNDLRVVSGSADAAGGGHMHDARREINGEHAERDVSMTRANGTIEPPAPPRPSYAGLHTEDLKKAIQNYGFKPINSRQKMIEKLEECWEQKEARRVAKDAQPDATQTVPMRPSDFISGVHDLSARPVPKTTKTKVKKVATKKAPTSPKEPKKRKRTNVTIIGGTGETEVVATAPKEPKKRTVVDINTANPSEAVEPAPKARTRKKATSKKTDEDAPDTPKKPRGRPRKAAIAPKVAILDVDDIDDDFTNLTTIREVKESKKARVKVIESELPTPPATLQISGTEPASEAVPDPATLLESLEIDIGQQIYAAILHQSDEAAQEPGRDHVRNPTWHEKILLYDPIVLEDLARWLNAEGLGKIKEDREVNALDVRGWCESQGICCLWKGGWRGQASKKNSD